MQIWHFSDTLTIVVDVLAWLSIHMFFSWFATALPVFLFSTDQALFRTRAFERGGALYNAWFRISKWKNLAPDGAALFKTGFRKAGLVSTRPAYLKRYIQETCRGEFAHWLVIGFSPLFFLWNPVWAGGVNVFYALAANLPFIMIQRYNRARLLRILNNNRSGSRSSIL